MSANISIHAPREGGDDNWNRMISPWPIFQSTPPARGATQELRELRRMADISIHAPREGGDRRVCYHISIERGHFNPRPPRGGRQVMHELDAADLNISIHAPREGGDTSWPGLFKARFLFQSTPPARGATEIKIKVRDKCAISIHAPREGGDIR